MDTKNFLTFTPEMPDLSSVDPRGIVLSYHPDADTLIVHLYGRERHAAMVDVTDHLLLRVDPRSHEVVGFQIEGFVTTVLPGRPDLLMLAEAAGVPTEAIETARQRVEPDQMKKAVLSTILNEFGRNLKPAVA